MANILALDASTKRTGYAYFKDGQIQFGAIASSSGYPEKRIGIMRDEILEIIKRENIDTIIMEEVRPDTEQDNKYRPVNLHTNKLLTWLQGCIVIAVFEYNKDIKIDFIGASSWRSQLGIQKYGVTRQGYKPLDIAYANKTYGLNLTAEQDDEADAICILTAYTKNAASLAPKVRLGKIGEDESAF